MSNINKKTALEAPTTSKTANESDHHSNTDHSNLILAHLPQGSLGGRLLDSWGGHDLQRPEYMAVYVRQDELAGVVRHPGYIKVCLECVAAHDEEYRRRESEKEDNRRRVQERAAKFEEELALIKGITGMTLSREDLVVFMAQARRHGKDFQPYLDALQAIDDLDLKRAGLTTWDVDLDAMDDEED